MSNDSVWCGNFGHFFILKFNSKVWTIEVCCEEDNYHSKTGCFIPRMMSIVFGEM